MEGWNDGFELNVKSGIEFLLLYNVGFIMIPFHQTLIHCGTFSHRFTTVSAPGINAEGWKDKNY